MNVRTIIEDAHSQTILCMAWDAFGRRLFTGAEGISSSLLTHPSLRHYPHFRNPSLLLSFSFSISCSPATFPPFRSLSKFNSPADHNVKVWELDTGKHIRTGIKHEGSVTSLVYVGKARLLFSSSLDGLIVGWNPAMKPVCEHKVRCFPPFPSFFLFFVFCFFCFFCCKVLILKIFKSGTFTSD
jgi:WD40 repeat protein